MILHRIGWAYLINILMSLCPLIEAKCTFFTNGPQLPTVLIRERRGEVRILTADHQQWMQPTMKTMRIPLFEFVQRSVSHGKIPREFELMEQRKRYRL